MRLFLIAAILVSVFGMLSSCDSDWSRAKGGQDVAPTAQAGYLGERLLEDLGYKAFDPAWLQKAWVNGFQDHTYLFIVVPGSTDLEASIEKVAGTEPISASFFRDGGYLGPSTAPIWWDTAAIDAASSRYFRKQSRLWRFTWIDSRLFIVLAEA